MWGAIHTNDISLRVRLRAAHQVHIVRLDFSVLLLLGRLLPANSNLPRSLWHCLHFGGWCSGCCVCTGGIFGLKIKQNKKTHNVQEWGYQGVGGKGGQKYVKILKYSTPCNIETHQKKGRVGEVNVLGRLPFSFSLAPRELAFTNQRAASSTLTRLLGSHSDWDRGGALSPLRLGRHPYEVKSVRIQICQPIRLSHRNVSVVSFLQFKYF